MSFNNPVQVLQKGTLNSPNVGSTVLGNIPSVPLISSRNYFLQSLESWISTPSMTTQWVVLIEDFPKTLKQEVLQELEHTSGDKLGWNIDVAVKSLGSYFLQKAIGCVFAQGFQTPKQTSNVNITDSKRGFLGSPIMESRAPNDFLSLDFLETNLSFVDAVIRPWVLLTAHKGLVARPEEESIKTDITILQYSRTNQFLSQIPRKVWTFYGCCPVDISSTEYNYKDESVEVRNGVKFAYNYYQVHHTTYIPIPSLIEKFMNGGIGEILGVSTIERSIDNITKNPLQTVGGIAGNVAGGALL